MYNLNIVSDIKIHLVFINFRTVFIHVEYNLISLLEKCQFTSATIFMKYWKIGGHSSGFLVLRPWIWLDSRLRHFYVKGVSLEFLDITYNIGPIKQSCNPYDFIATIKHIIYHPFVKGRPWRSWNNNIDCEIKSLWSILNLVLFYLTAMYYS